MTVCPVCASEIVRITGDEQADILLIGSVPNEEELKYHKPFSGGTGQIFRRELFRNADIELNSCRLALLWYHENNKNDDCLSVSADLVTQEMIGRKYIILIGAQTVNYYTTGLSVDKVNGLEITEAVRISDTEYINPNQSRVFALVNPSSIFARGVGELRFGLRAIKKGIENGR